MNITINSKLKQVILFFNTSKNHPGFKNLEGLLLLEGLCSFDEKQKKAAYDKISAQAARRDSGCF
ncbi:MAG TPA: hypothetical protein ENH29_06230 [Bacteroidetes bacterium]|nr:hypothetical protein [Bacteroidota bacterium]